MRRLFFFLAVVLMALPMAALTADPVEIDPAIVDQILASGLLGFGVIAITQILKTALKVGGGIVVFGLSLAVSAAAVLVFLITGGGFVLMKFIGYTVTVWVLANGWYKFKAA